MKISIGMRLQAGPWGGGNQFGRALADYLTAHGITVCFDLDTSDIDLILLAEPRPELNISAYTDRDIRWYTGHINPRAVVVHRINECDERKGTQGVNALLMEANRCADYTVFISEWLQNLFLGQGLQTPAYSFIRNGGDTEIFHPRGFMPWGGREKLRLVTHHWGTSRLKGFDIYEQLDAMLGKKDYQNRLEFTYIGQTPADFQFKNARYLEPLSGAALATELRQHHAYITASQFEPAGMHHIEGALCGLPLLYRESGALPEYCGGFGVGFSGNEDFESRLGELIDSYDQWLENMPTYPHTAERMCMAYLTLFEGLLQERESTLAHRQREKITPSIEDNLTWVKGLKSGLTAFLERLRTPAGYYQPSTQGVFLQGDPITLPFSCLALKTAVMIGYWDELPSVEQEKWISTIQDYQVRGNPVGVWAGQGAFVDPALLKYVAWQVLRRQQWIDRLFFPWRMGVIARMLSAESKQAIATLREVGAQSRYPYQGFPSSLRALQRYLNAFDWSQPWEAGAHLSTLAVFLRHEAPRFLPPQQITPLVAHLITFITKLADPTTGAYFQGTKPEYGELVNGAMKILTALDWLEIPIHYPEKLIDTCLARLPAAEGCHVVDVAYVLYRCSAQSDHRRADVQAYCAELLEMIRAHHHPEDGGFSYYLNLAQTHYQRVVITRNAKGSDIHGTILLTWALGMVMELLGTPLPWWRNIKP